MPQAKAQPGSEVDEAARGQSVITDMAQEMVSLVEIKRRLATIEQGQSVLCERLDAVMKLLEGFALFHSFVLFEHKKRMDERYDLGWTRGLQYANAAVDTQSKAKPKRRNREAKKGR